MINTLVISEITVLAISENKYIHHIHIHSYSLAYLVHFKARNAEYGIELISSFDFKKHFCLKTFPESLPQLGELCLNVTRRTLQKVLEAEIPQRREILAE